jgi:hypothetical protein
MGKKRLVIESIKPRLLSMYRTKSKYHLDSVFVVHVPTPFFGRGSVVNLTPPQ